MTYVTGPLQKFPKTMQTLATASQKLWHFLVPKYFSMINLIWIHYQPYWSAALVSPYFVQLVPMAHSVC